jgi:hypothetical protein
MFGPGFHPGPTDWLHVDGEGDRRLITSVSTLHRHETLQPCQLGEGGIRVES